jgi:hypothetical protein
MSNLPAATSIAQRRRELARQQKQDIQMKSGRREKTVKPPAGKSKWRILPSWRGADDPSIGHAWGQHFVRNQEDELVAVHMCLDKTYGKHCPICESLSRAIKHSNDEQQKVLEQAKATGRYLVNALHVDGEDPNTPVVLELSPTTYEKVMDLIDQWMDEEFGEIDLLDLSTGRDIIINKTGKGLNTNYDVTVAPKERAVNAEVMKKVVNLDDYVKQEHEESQRKALEAFDHISTGIKALPYKKPSDDSMKDVLDGDFTSVGDDDSSEETSKASTKAAAATQAEMDEIDDILGELDDLGL